MTENLIATAATRLVSVPMQSSEIVNLGIRGRGWIPVEKGATIDILYKGFVEGSNIVGDKVDGDDYYIVYLAEPLSVSTQMVWFAYAHHWKEEHFNVEDTAPPTEVVTEIATAAELSIALEKTNHGLKHEELVEVLGKAIRLPTYDRPVYLREPVAFIDGAPVPFNWGEVTKGGSRIPPNASVIQNIKKIAKRLVKARSAFAQPIIVNSWYRDPITNKRVKGSSRSRHLSGDAVDWYPKFDGITEDGWKMLCGLYKDGGLAAGRGFYHTDSWNTREWSYRGAPAYTKKRHY